MTAMGLSNFEAFRCQPLLPEQTAVFVCIPATSYKSFGLLGIPNSRHEAAAAASKQEKRSGHPRVCSLSDLRTACQPRARI